MTLDTPLEILPETWPLYAPLPRPFLLHLYKRGQHRLPGQTLAQQIQLARTATYTIFDPFVRGHGLTSQWVLNFLTMQTPDKSAVSTGTLSLWRERGLVRDRERGHPDPQNAAALLIARMIDDRERNWLPLEMAPDEPAWWCWRQDSPGSPVIPCPVPLPADLPATSLLWTPWEGAAWDAPWVSLESLGAARWAGASGKQHELALTREALAAWDPEVAALHMPNETALGKSAQQEILRAKAAVILLRAALVSTRLGTSIHRGG
ncbi:MAG: hypothetical protein WCD86_17210 [Ktedonobacteraceae bacterium]